MKGGAIPLIFTALQNLTYKIIGLPLINLIVSLLIWKGSFLICQMKLNLSILSSNLDLHKISFVNVAVLQIRRGKRDNLEINFHITPLKCILGTHH